MQAEQSVSIETITPAKAEEFLARSKNFRRLVEKRADRLARVIKLGKWRVTPDAIAFDSKGFLVNGQHRLRACILAEKPITALVIHGAINDGSLDSGAARRVSDYASAMGFYNPFVAAAIARFVWFHETENWPPDRQGSVRPSIWEVVDILQRRRAEVDEASVQGSRCAHFMPGSVAGFAYLIANRMDPKKAKQFLDGLASGSDLPANSPLLRLRERMVMRAEGHAGAKRWLRHHALALVVKAWNLWITGEEAQRLTYIHRKEEFPIFFPVGTEVRGYRSDGAPIFEYKGTTLLSSGHARSEPVKGGTKAPERRAGRKTRAARKERDSDE